MYFFDPELEQAALKAYFEDPITDDTENEDSNEDYYDGGHQNKHLNHKVFSQEIDFEEISESQYEGGSDKKKKVKDSLKNNDKKSEKKPERKISSARQKGKVEEKNENCFQKFQSKIKQFISQSNGLNNGKDKSGKSLEWENMSKQEREKRGKELWQVARRYTNKLRFQARLQKMAEHNLKEMMIDDINEDADEDNQVIDSAPKLKWYLIDVNSTFCKVWNFLITILIIYTMFVSPFILVFPDVYQKCDDSGYCAPVYDYQKTLNTLEMVIDIIYFIEILMNFVKKTLAYKTIQQISWNYLTGYFVFDIIATIPELFMNQSVTYYFLKCFRIIHFFRLSDPLQLLLNFALQKYSKKRQNDLIGFARLILYVIYISHIMACVWLALGMQIKCPEPSDQSVICINSWVYNYGFDSKPYYTRYIFAFYWIFEVITTVGYGDYTGHTSNEYIFSICLEFLGLTFFSFLMGSINGIFNTSDNFDDLIEEKLDSLDMWIKKIEKSNKPFHIQPSLYNDIRKYVEQAFLYDFNLVIEEFQFYQQITPKMQTDLIQNTRVFKEFERSFNHFFEECERGFTNELIINMYTRIYTPGKTIIGYKSSVKEMFFIRQGLVEVYNNENDEKFKEKPIIYLPKFSYFGDYQILNNLKSNIVFKTLSISQEDHRQKQNEPLPDIIFMCVSKDVLIELCELFPQTAENIKKRSLERRLKFMDQKNLNSHRYDKKLLENTNTALKSSNDEKKKNENGEEIIIDKKPEEDQTQNFYSDEEPENFESQKEDMKMYLNKLNKKIDHLVDALKQADSMMAKMVDQRSIIEQIMNKKKSKEQDPNAGPENKSISEFFQEQINKKF